MHTRVSPIVSLILLVGVLAMLPACGSSPTATSSSGASQGPGTGSVVFTTTWEPPPRTLAASKPAPLGPGPAPSAPAVDVCVDYGIDTVSMQVLSGANIIAENSFPCGAHTGTLKDVPAGNNLVLRLQGSIGGTVLWRGNSDNTIGVHPGQTTDAGKVTVAYIGNDSVAPTIVSVSPDNNAKNIPNASTVRIQFNERMAINTIVDNVSIRIVDNAANTVAGTVGYNAADNSALFTPESPFVSGGNYTLTVSPAVTDMAGRPLPGPYVSNFAAHTAGTFVRPVLLETYDGVSVGPVGIVGDPLGNVMVVGTIRGTPELLWYNRFDAARKQWGASARIPPESFAPLAVGAVKLVSDNTGNALLLYEYSMNNIDLVLVAKEYNAVLDWSRTNVFLSSSLKSSQNPTAGIIGGHVDIASDGIGNAITVWVTSVSGVDSLWAKRFLSGVGWEPLPVQLTFTNDVHGTGSISFPKVAMNSRGDAVVAWGEPTSARAIRYTPGTGWEGSISTLDNQASNSFPSVVMDADGNGVAMWVRTVSGEVMANRYAFGQGWEAPVRINGTDITRSPSQTDIDVDGAGRVVALWGDSSAGPLRLRARRYSPVGGWGTIVTVADLTGGPPHFSMNVAGQGVVASRAGSPLNAYAVRYDGNSDTWGNVMIVDDSPATGALEAFSYVGPNGTPYVTWGWANNDPPNTFASWVE